MPAQTAVMSGDSAVLSAKGQKNKTVDKVLPAKGEEETSIDEV